jgi:hypothetical protein
MTTKVTTVVECIEVDGKEPGVATHPRPSIEVRSHWNRSELAVIAIGEKTYTFLRRELEAAIQNAGNRGALA